MSSSAILLDVPGQGRETLNCIRPAAEKAGVTLRLFAGNDLGIEDLIKYIATGEEPSAFLMGPDLPRPLAVARKVHKVAPLVQIMFLVRAERLSQMQKDLSMAPMIGSDWSIANMDADELTQRLGSATRSTTQRRQLRTTLDHINLQISSWPTDNGLAYRRLMISERYLAAILAHAPVAIISADIGGLIISWNRGAEQLFQLPEREAIGRRIEDVAAGEWGEQIQNLIRVCQSVPQPSPRDVACRRADGTRFYVDLVVAPIRDESNRVMGISALARDITDRERAHQQLTALNQNLESLVTQRTSELARSNRDLEQFAYVVSHDLRAPLRAVGGFCELLRIHYQDKLEAEAVEYIQSAVDGVVRMGTLIDDLLKYSRVGSAVERPEPSDCTAVVQEAIRDLKPSIEATGAALHYDKLPTVNASRSQMLQLFENLIGNAIKYHSDKPPDIRIASKARRGEWLFSVSDNGIGIDPKFRDRIFEVFQRLHTREEYEGTGIGLAVCKRIVERHGGQVWVESERGQGCTFFFTLPKTERKNEKE